MPISMVPALPAAASAHVGCIIVLDQVMCPARFKPAHTAPEAPSGPWRYKTSRRYTLHMAGPAGAEVQARNSGGRQRTPHDTVLATRGLSVDAGSRTSRILRWGGFSGRAASDP